MLRGPPAQLNRHPIIPETLKSQSADPSVNLMPSGGSREKYIFKISFRDNKENKKSMAELVRPSEASLQSIIT